MMATRTVDRFVSTAGIRHLRSRTGSSITFVDEIDDLMVPVKVSWLEERDPLPGDGYTDDDGRTWVLLSLTPINDRYLSLSDHGEVYFRGLDEFDTPAEDLDLADVQDAALEAISG